MSSYRVPAIQSPTNDPESLRQAIQQIKQALEADWVAGRAGAGTFFDPTLGRPPPGTPGTLASQGGPHAAAHGQLQRYITGADLARRLAEKAFLAASEASGDASGAAASAAASATSASASATTASNAAGQAQTAATAAQTHAANAATQAGNASSSATLAALSATDSQTYRNEAAALVETATKTLGFGIHPNPAFFVWSGTLPEHWLASSTPPQVVEQAVGRYGNAVRLYTGASPTAAGPIFYTRSDIAQLTAADSIARLDVYIQVQLLSGSFNQVELEVAWFDSSDVEIGAVRRRLSDHIPNTFGVIHSPEFYIVRPAGTAFENAAYTRIAVRINRTGTLLVSDILIHSFQFREVVGESSASIALSSVGDLQGNLAASVVLRAKAGSGGAELELVAASDPINGAASTARVAASDIILNGTVQFQAMSTGGGPNLVQDSSFSEGTDYWDLLGSGLAGAQTRIVTAESGVDDVSVPTGENVLILEQTGAETAGYAEATLLGRASSGEMTPFFAPVTPNEYYELTANVAAEACTGELQLRFLDEDGLPAGSPTIHSIPSSTPSSSPLSWTRPWLRAQAPAAARYVSMRLRKNALSGATPDLIPDPRVPDRLAGDFILPLTWTSPEALSYYENDPSATTRVTNGSAFDASTWTKTNITVTANFTTAPDSTTTAERLTPNTTNGAHIVQNVGSLINTEQHYVYQVYAKANGYNWIRLAVTGPTFGGEVYSFFNVSTGAVGTLQSGIADAGIESVGNGWFRCWIRIVSSIMGSASMIVGVHSTESLANYAGNNTSGVFLWDASGFRQRRVSVPELSYATVAGPASVTAPGFRLEPSTVTSEHSIRRTTLSLEADIPHRVEVYARPSGLSWLGIRITGTPVGSPVSALMNASTGAFGTVAGASSTEALSVGDGWYRFRFVFTPSAAGECEVALFVSSGNNFDPFLGVSGDDIEVAAPTIRRLGRFSRVMMFRPQIVRSHADTQTPAPYVRDAKTVISGDSIVTGSLSASRIGAGKLRAQFIEIDDLLSIEASSGALAVGKEGTFDEVNSGIYLGRTDDNGTPGFGLITGGVSKLGRPEYLRHTSEAGLILKNPKFIVDSSKQQSGFASAGQTVDLPIGTLQVSFTAIGGGASGSAPQAPSVHNPGQALIVRLFDGTTDTGQFWTAPGGVGSGTRPSTGFPGNAGIGGTRGSRYTNREGGSCQDQVYGSDGANGSKISVVRADTSGLANPRLVLQAGQGGASITTTGGHVLCSRVNAGPGTAGGVSWTATLGQDYPAGICSFLPAYTGTFTVTSGVAGFFPEFGEPGLWVVYNCPASFAIRWNREDTGLTSVGVAGATAIGMSRDLPSYSAPGSTRTLTYQLFPSYAET